MIELLNCKFHLARSYLLNCFKNIADKYAVPFMLNTLDGREILAREKLFSDAGFRRVGHKYGYGL